MTLASPSQSVPGTEITAAKINDPVNNIAAVVNGNIDDTNISSVSGSKLANTSVTTGKIASGAVTPDKLATGAVSNVVATSQTTTSTSYTDLSTVGPTVTVTIGANGLALVSLYVATSSSAVSANHIVAFNMSGANTYTASGAGGDQYGMRIPLSPTATTTSRFGSTVLLTGLTPGSTTFTMRYAVSTGTGTFLDRRLSVIPL